MMYNIIPTKKPPRLGRLVKNIQIKAFCFNLSALRFLLVTDNV
jgi:hypothetical protein